MKANIMTENTLLFRYEFSIDGVPQVFPSGPYDVESLNKIARAAPNSMRGETGISLYIPMDPGDFGCDRTFSTSLQDLSEALMRDNAPVRFRENGRITHVTLAEIGGSRYSAMDQRAMERAENEGMTPHPNG